MAYIKSFSCDDLLMAHFDATVVILMCYLPSVLHAGIRTERLDFTSA